DYPEFEDEVNILKSVQYQHPVTTLEPVISDSKFVELQQDIKDIHVEDKVSRYIVEIVKATRKHSDIELGASPRGSIGLFKMSQAWAAVDGRDYVIPDDIKDVFHNVLDHRLIIRSDSQLRGIKVTNITDKIIKKIDIPVGV
ncbi:MAG: AAA family ATPase, partial [Halothermotrichaceae bacterium]